jgi:hypothetical protein
MQRELYHKADLIPERTALDVRAEVKGERKFKRRALAALPYLLLTVAILLAWFPAVRNYTAVADDYLDLTILKDGWAGWYRIWGIWRIWGIPLSTWAVKTHPLAPGLLVLGAHLAAVYCFYRVCVLLFKDSWLSLVLALLMGIFPWGYEALLWSAAQFPVLAHPLFWANLIVLLSYSRREREQQKLAFALSFLLTALCSLGSDYLIFSSMVSGIIVWLPEGKLSWSAIKRRMISHYSGWAPLLASLSYIVVWKLVSENAVRDYKAPSLNLRSILSTYYYQYTNAWIFQPWFNPVTRRLIFFSWGWPQIVAAAFLLLALFTLLIIVFSKTALNEANVWRSKENILPYIILLLLGASLVYAMSGGFSLDSRKKYSLIPLILLLLGWAWRKLTLVPARASIRNVALLSLLIAAGVSTTWLGIGAWRYEVLRHAALVDYLKAHAISGEIQLESQPDLYAAWPKLQLLIGFRMDDTWVLNNALGYQGAEPVQVSHSSESARLRFDPDRFRWEQAPR